MTPDATGNDDQSWWALAAITAAENGLPQSGSIPWIDLARNVYEEQKTRWSNDTCSGGLRWKILEGDGTDGFHYKNAITNGLFFQLAARLGDTDWAEGVYEWSTGVGLIDAQFSVFDGTDEQNGCADLNHDMWSYNVGVFLYGAAVMARRTGEEKWVRRTRGFVAAARRNFVNEETGALWEGQCEGREEGCNTDQVSFKGILARWLGAAAEILPEVKEDVQGVLNGAAKAVLAGGMEGLGPIESLNALEVVDAELRALGIGGAQGMIGPAGRRRRRSVAGRVLW
jgi:mannan endo-1,6-alpha-mannosidase